MIPPGGIILKAEPASSGTGGLRSFFSFNFCCVYTSPVLDDAVSGSKKLSLGVAEAACDMVALGQLWEPS